jgi:hypothetical protein
VTACLCVGSIAFCDKADGAKIYPASASLVKHAEEILVVV